MRVHPVASPEPKVPWRGGAQPRNRLVDRLVTIHSARPSSGARRTDRARRQARSTRAAGGGPADHVQTGKGGHRRRGPAPPGAPPAPLAHGGRPVRSPRCRLSAPASCRAQGAARICQARAHARTRAPPSHTRSLGSRRRRRRSHAHAHSPRGSAHPATLRPAQSPRRPVAPRADAAAERGVTRCPNRPGPPRPAFSL